MAPSASFAELPLEVCKEIKAYLSPASTAPDKDTQDLPGNQNIDHLAKDQQIDILKDRAGSLPDYIACPECIVLHQIVDAKEYLRDYVIVAGRTATECASRGLSASGSGLGPALHPCAFRMAMKAAQQPRGCQELLALLCALGRLDPGVRGIPRYQMATTVECRVVGGEMLNCEVRSFLSPGIGSSAFQVDSHLRICLHLDFGTDQLSVGIWTNSNWRSNPRRLRAESCTDSLPERGFYLDSPRSVHGPENDIWKVTWMEADSAWRGTSSDLIRCQYCDTECQLDFQSYPAVGNTMFLTVWKNLGADPDDKKLSRHINLDGCGVLPHGPHEPGTISEAFEQGRQFEQVVDDSPLDSQMTESSGSGES